MLAVVLPNGCFFRGGAELAVRKELVDADLIESDRPASGRPLLRRRHPGLRPRSATARSRTNGRPRADDRRSAGLRTARHEERPHRRGDPARHRNPQDRDEEDGYSRWVTDDEMVSRGIQLDGPSLHLTGRRRRVVPRGRSGRARSIPSCSGTTEPRPSQRSTLSSLRSKHRCNDGAVAACPRSVNFWPNQGPGLSSSRAAIIRSAASTGSAAECSSANLSVGGETRFRPFYTRSGPARSIYSRLKAFEGAFALVPPAADGWYVSNEFPTFDVNKQRACPTLRLRSCLAGDLAEHG